MEQVLPLVLIGWVPDTDPHTIIQARRAEMVAQVFFFFFITLKPRVIQKSMSLKYERYKSL